MLSTLIYKYEKELKALKLAQHNIEMGGEQGPGRYNEISLLEKVIADLKSVDKDIELAILHGAN